MYEMVIGHPPFYAETQEETYQKIIQYEEFLQIPEDCDLQ